MTTVTQSASRAMLLPKERRMLRSLERLHRLQQQHIAGFSMREAFSFLGRFALIAVLWPFLSEKRLESIVNRARSKTDAGRPRAAESLREFYEASVLPWDGVIQNADDDKLEFEKFVIRHGSTISEDGMHRFYMGAFPRGEERGRSIVIDDKWHRVISAHAIAASDRDEHYDARLSYVLGPPGEEGSFVCVPVASVQWVVLK